MALTPEQQSQVDIHIAVESARQQAQIDTQIAVENARHANVLELENRRAKLEAVRLAKEVLVENARSKPIDTRDISADDVKNYAQTLMNYINE
jgi:hypothetical protein